MDRGLHGQIDQLCSARAQGEGADLEALRALILGELERREWTQTRLAEAAGCTKQHVSATLRGLSWPAHVRLARALARTGLKQ